MKRHLKTVHEKRKEAKQEEQEIPASPANPQMNLEEETFV